MRRAKSPRSVNLAHPQVDRVRALFGDQRVLSRLVRRGLDWVLADEEEKARQRGRDVIQAFREKCKP